MGILQSLKSVIDSLREGFQEGMQHKSLKDNFDESYQETHDKAYHAVSRAFFGRQSQDEVISEHDDGELPPKD